MRADQEVVRFLRARVGEAPQPAFFFASRFLLVHGRGIHPRRIKEAVRQLRSEGMPICSSAEGYWLARDQDELDAYLERERRRARESLAILAKVEKVTIREAADRLF